MKRASLIALPLIALLAILLFQQSSNKQDEPSLQSQKSDAKSATRSAKPDEDFDPTQVITNEANVRRFSQMFMAFVKLGYTPEQVLAAFQKMYKEDRDALVQTMVRLEDAPEELNRELLPLLGEAFILWPEIEGVFLAFLGYPYQELMPTEAAEWGTEFLVTNNRKDLVVASAIANLASVDESRAIELVGTLPEKAKVKAVGSLADNMDLSDPERMMEFAKEWDPEQKSHFTERVFHHYGFERLEEISAWLAEQPNADPTATAAIAVHMTIQDDKMAAIEWADSIQNDEARAAAISATYQRWSLSDFDGAVGDILTHYPDDLQLVADVFKGTTYERAGSAVASWDQALNLQNESARTYALTGLLEPMLLSHGLETTQQHINSLPAGSLERQAAELTLTEVVKRPVIARQLEVLAQNAAEEARGPLENGDE